MVIGVDLDGVLNDLHSTWLAQYNLDSGDTLTVDDLHSYDVSRYVKPGYEKRIYELLDTPGLFRYAPVIPNAKAGMQALIDMGHEVLIVSAFYPHANSCAEKISWLETHFPAIDLGESLVFTKNKSRIKLDILIDDCPDNIQCLDASAYGILFSKPFNKNYKLDSQTCYRVKDWPEVISAVIQISKQGKKGKAC